MVKKVNCGGGGASRVRSEAFVAIKGINYIVNKLHSLQLFKCQDKRIKGLKINIESIKTET